MKKENKKAYRASLSKEDYKKLTGFDGDWRDSWWNDSYLNMMAQQWKLDQVQTILDVGCGVGHWGQRLMRHLNNSATIYGIDPETNWIKGAEERAKKLGLNTRSEYKVASVESLPFDDNSLDMVTCQTVLIHVKDIKTAVKEMIRVLKPGGLFLCAEPNNFGRAAAQYVEEPLMAWKDISDLLELEYICTMGKLKVGEGHQSAGHLIPAILQEFGLENVQVKTNNQCASITPPYSDLGSKTMIKLMQDTWDNGAAFVLGSTEINCRRYYLEGGGDNNSFPRLWNLARRHLKKTLEKMNEGTYVAAGGNIHYLVWGHKGIH